MSSAPGAAPGRSTATRAGGMVAQELFPGEQVLWSGQPGGARVRLADLAFAAYVLAGATVLVVLGTRSTRDWPAPGRAFVIVVAAAAILQAAAILVLVAIAPEQRRRTVYQLTDLRVLVTTGLRARHTWSAYLDQIGEPALRGNRDGTEDLLLRGGGGPAFYRLLAGAAGSGLFSPPGLAEFPVLEHLPDAGQAQQVMAAARRKALDAEAAARMAVPPGHPAGPVPPSAPAPAAGAIPAAPVVVGPALQPGEQVLWTGRPQHVPWWFGLSDIYLSLFGLAWLACVGLMGAMAETVGSGAFLIFLVPFALVGGVYPAAGRVVHRRLRIRRSQYIVTDRRLAVSWQLLGRPVTVEEQLGRLLPPMVCGQSVFTGIAEPAPRRRSGGWRNLPWPASTISPPALIGIADPDAARDAIAAAQLAARQSAG